MTLRGRLTLATTAVVIVLTLAFGLALYLLLLRADSRDALLALRAVARREAVLVQHGKRMWEPKGGAAALISPRGAVLRGRWPVPLPLPRQGGRPSQALRLRNGGHALMVRQADGDYIAVARPDPQAVQQLRRVRHDILLVGLAAVAAAGLISWLIAGGMLRPLRRVAQTAADIARHGDVTRRLGRLGEGEMLELSQAFDAMLDRLDHALAQQRQAIERERQFAAEAAHVLRNPLSTVILNLEFLERRLPAQSETLAAARDAREEAERLLHLSESLLRLARGESVAEDAPPVDVGTVAAEAARVVADARGGPAAEVQVTGDAEVRGDRAALFGMLESLLDNAYKYSPKDAPVALRVASSRGLVRIVVEDRGQGIGADDLPHVFDRFYRGTDRAQGHGLGLAIARAVALAHGGQISIASRLGEGTQVTVELPAFR